MTTSIRLAKRLAGQVPCSRQEAEQYIAGGWVTVDGQTVEEPGFRVEPEQVVALAAKAKPDPVLPVTLLLHKPAGMEAEALLRRVSVETQAAGDRSGLRFLKRHTGGQTLCGALEDSASGLLVYSQDWKTVRMLVDDRANVEQEYVAEVSGDIVPYGLALLRSGLSFKGRPLPAANVSWQSEQRLRFALRGAQPGQIEDMCRQVGLTLLGLKRLRIGRMPLSSLPVGEWRYLLGFERF